MSVMTLSKKFLFLLLGVQLQSCVAALDPRSLSWSRALHVASRQVSGIPSQCQTSCSAASDLVNADCTPAQCCTSSFENNYVSCIECVGSAANLTDYSQFQTIVDQLVVLCSANGIAIPKITFPGQDPNRQLSTSAIPSSTSGAASGTGGGSSTSISHSTISETSVITAISSQTSASTSISSISQSTVTSLAPASSTSVTERSSAAASAITTPASSASTTSAAPGTAPAPAGTADSAVALGSDMLWMVPALVAFFFSA